MRPPARANSAAATIAPGAKSAPSLQIAATTRVRDSGIAQNHPAASNGHFTGSQ